MHISDWSSVVCSSNLTAPQELLATHVHCTNPLHCAQPPCAMIPPSTVMHSPVRKDAPPLARKATTRAHSAGPHKRFLGQARRNRPRQPFSGMPLATSPRSAGATLPAPVEPNWQVYQHNPLATRQAIER